MANASVGLLANALQFFCDMDQFNEFIRNDEAPSYEQNSTDIIKAKLLTSGDTLHVLNNNEDQDESESTWQTLLGPDGSLVFLAQEKWQKDDGEFLRMKISIEEAVKNGLYPTRIPACSYGSYLVSDEDANSVAIFNPKDEEKYAIRNPSWKAYFQKMFYLCRPGRGFLLANQRYLSEVGASIVDEYLNLKVVPKTKVAYLASPTFCYSSKVKRKAKTLMENTSDVKLPNKVGSLQCLVEGFKPSKFWLKQFASKQPLSDELQYELKLQFERVVVMDYMIRNMNRTAENLLIRYDDRQRGDRNVQVKIAAIDNGLAFPYRHPSSWRPYTYHWASLPMAKKPFSNETRSFILQTLTDAKRMSSLIEDLKKVFQLDVNFDQEYFEWQMMVMQGQILNLKDALQNRETPYQLVQKRPLYVKTDPSNRTIPVLRLRVRNFMCHRDIDLVLGERVNFIIGVNGSGKSALLSAIMVALGCRAVDTNRGLNLSDYVKEGESFAMVEITLCNSGVQSYQSDIYGDCIIVRRRIGANGSSRYSICNSNGIVVCRKYATLRLILSKMNIQPMNPAMILTQDFSRNFLNVVDGKKLYSFFNRCTMLDQVKSFHQSTLQAIAECEPLRKKKNKDFSDMKAEIDRLYKRIMLQQKLQDAKQRIEEVKKEHAWASVTISEEKVKELENLSVSIQSDIAEAKTNVEQFRNRLLQLTSDIDDHQQKAVQLRNQAKEVSEKVILVQRDIRAVKLEEEEQNRKLKILKADAKRAEDEFRELQAKEQEKQKEKENLLNEKEKKEKLVEELKKQVEDWNSQLEVSTSDIRMLENTIAEEESEVRLLMMQIKDLQIRCAFLEKQLSIVESPGGALARFHANMPHFCETWKEMVETGGYFSKPPIGPLGNYVTVRDPKWALAIENCLQNYLNSFIVETWDDMKTLQNLSKEFQMSDDIIFIIMPYDNDVPYDVSSGEAKCIYPTVLSMVEISNPIVFNTLVDYVSIEKKVLVPNQEEMFEYMQNNPPKDVKAAFSADGWECRAQPVFRLYASDLESPRCLASTNAELMQSLQNEYQDVLSELNSAKQNLETSKMKLEKFAEEHERRKKEMEEFQEKIPLTVEREAELQKELIKLEDQINQSNWEIDDELLTELENKFLIEDEKVRKQEAVIENLHISYRNVKEIEKKYLAESEELSKTLKDTLNRLREIDNECVTVTSQRDEENKKIAKLNLQAETTLQEISDAENEVMLAIDCAKRACSCRMESDRTFQEIDEEMKSLLMRIAIDEEYLSDADDLKQQLESRTDELREYQKELESLNACSKEIQERADEQKQNIIFLQNKLSQKVQRSFDKFLKHRKFNGELIFSHKKENLKIHVVRHDGHQFDGRAIKDLRALSGGERSFVTICFLLSIWNVTDTPFRCLDEFDIFMDMVNRDLSTEMLLEFAEMESNKNRQFLIFSPLQISKAVTGRNVKIIKVSKPCTALS
ncbi:Structural maintenance of chromosomes protein 6 [Trichinella papuae]|uniref:Structural maintenance of chromosomes protein 6 n=1 Tax=Trichinella papuae TaxID=268474 RepID=A0A0V1N426_9BILA|nr:Structural maintenance of chromosomes protein 6 [Trichinella papuae]